MRLHVRPLLLAVALVLTALGLGPSLAVEAAPPVPWTADGPTTRVIVVADAGVRYRSLVREARAAGAAVTSELPDALAFGAQLSPATVTALRTRSDVRAVIPDPVLALPGPWVRSTADSASQVRPDRVNLSGLRPSADPGLVMEDPATRLGMQWEHERMRVPQAHLATLGSRSVKVAVVDTGVDYDHAELQGKVVKVIDAVGPQGLCGDAIGVGEAGVAATFGVDSDQDFNGHGTAVAGAIAAARDGVGVNGVAPGVSILSVKVLGWCGFGYLSDILEGISAAIESGAQIVNISLGGYLDRSDPEDAEAYRLGQAIVQVARSRGTVIIAAAGNEHLRFGTGGRVLSHGSLTSPGGQVDDYFGLYNFPVGLPGVVAVTATNNVVGTPSMSCSPDDSESTFATCKPLSDEHDPFGAGQLDQLSFSSNYGPRVDVAAPGGAPKFNLPLADRGGTPGYPFTTADGVTVFESFGITSNYALGVPIFFINDGDFYAFEAYTTVAGTSIASANAAGVAALAMSSSSRHGWSAGLLLPLMIRAVDGNATPPLSASDTSVADLTGGECPSGYCHLGGAAVPDGEAYGSGIVDAVTAVRASPGRRTVWPLAFR